MNWIKSEEMYQRALQVIIGGVNSPSRSYKAVGGGTPLFMEKAKGATYGMWTGTGTSIFWLPMGPSSSDTDTHRWWQRLPKLRKTVPSMEPQPPMKLSLPP
ncbi:hypothetical protein CULT_1640013 [[Clostridium] ultunense Esp]|nr:hypothetical protein CULT_1640013 [[Clostridium] ultunense Esp]